MRRVVSHGELNGSYGASRWRAYYKPGDAYFQVNAVRRVKGG